MLILVKVLFFVTFANVQQRMVMHQHMERRMEDLEKFEREQQLLEEKVLQAQDEAAAIEELLRPALEEPQTLE